MNKQRKVLITITYNEMGIIIDTKAEEVAQPNLQPTCNQLATDINVGDTIYRQQAIDAINTWLELYVLNHTMSDTMSIQDMLRALPSAQSERKNGRWIRNDNGTYSCSVCQSWIPEQQHCYARYCLYCGADMRGENDEGLD